MSVKIYSKITEWAERARRGGWDVKLRPSPVRVPAAIAARYGAPPDQYRCFLESVVACGSDALGVQVLCAGDFADVPVEVAHASFTWDEFERISLEAAKGDAELMTHVVAFWNRHLPVARVVRDGYELFAICVDDGTIVHGVEPEFEESSEVVYETFLDFLDAQLS